MQNMRFEGKVVIVTGASSGIGRSTARLFAMEGAKVVAAAASLRACTRCVLSRRAASRTCVCRSPATIVLAVSSATRRLWVL